jgi:hypothetical protein
MTSLITLMVHKFYSTEIIVGGWATYHVYGPFHRYRASLIVEDCRLRALEIIAEEKIEDKTNVEYLH